MAFVTSSHSVASVYTSSTDKEGFISNSAEISSVYETATTALLNIPSSYKLEGEQSLADDFQTSLSTSYTFTTGSGTPFSQNIAQSVLTFTVSAVEEMAFLAGFSTDSLFTIFYEKGYSIPLAVNHGRSYFSLTNKEEAHFSLTNNKVVLA